MFFRTERSWWDPKSCHKVQKQTVFCFFKIILVMFFPDRKGRWTVPTLYRLSESEYPALRRQLSCDYSWHFCSADSWTTVIFRCLSHLFHFCLLWCCLSWLFSFAFDTFTDHFMLNLFCTVPAIAFQLQSFFFFFFSFFVSAAIWYLTEHTSVAGAHKKYF